MSWAYELLDSNISLEKSALLSTNVLLGLIFGFTLTIGFFDYLWIIAPTLSASISNFATKVLEPIVIL